MSTTQVAAEPVLRDRSTGLVVSGIVQILIGCASALIALSVIAVSMWAPSMTAAPTMKGAMMLPAVTLYLLAAVGFVWLGIGSILARRWAWALTVIVSWLWLIMGVGMLVGFLFSMGPMLRAMTEMQPKAPPQALLVGQIGAVLFMAVIYILLPIIFLLFYHKASVRETCRRRDPKIRWTDRCPLPVLAMSIAMAFATMSALVSGASGFVMPMFGTLVSGVTGAVVALITALITACLAWGAYRLKMAAWWGMLLLWIAGNVSMGLNLARTSPIEMYEKMIMGFPPEQLEMMRKAGMTSWAANGTGWMMAVGCVLVLGYLYYVRRYFVRRV